MLHDTDGGAPGLVGGQPHVVAGDVQASHVALEHLIVAAAVTPVYRRNQLRQPTENLHNPQPSREYLKVFMNLVIP